MAEIAARCVIPAIIGVRAISMRTAITAVRAISTSIDARDAADVVSVGDVVVHRVVAVGVRAVRAAQPFGDRAIGLIVADLVALEIGPIPGSGPAAGLGATTEISPAPGFGAAPEIPTPEISPVPECGPVPEIRLLVGCARAAGVGLPSRGVALVAIGHHRGLRGDRFVERARELRRFRVIGDEDRRHAEGGRHAVGGRIGQMRAPHRLGIPRAIVRRLAATALQFLDPGGVGVQRGPIHGQIAVEEALQILAENRQLGAQSGHFGGVGADFMAHPRLDAEFVLPARGDLAFQLQLVHGLQIAHLGLVHRGFFPEFRGCQRADRRCPQRRYQADPYELQAIAENQKNAGNQSE
ncbi:hypothetical protein IT779_33960 [Nocardia sp. NEAU-351]|uniref:Uncharacterized protein n=1 Tax=Nocardia bovistercoris TaxID=2785916 RepID=A0A931IH22_9NOCA|nr:hypothetical protein [Nocardia bovistercoris]